MPDRLTADDGNDDEEGGNGIDGTVPLPVLKCSSLKKGKTFFCCQIVKRLMEMMTREGGFNRIDETLHCAL